MSKNLLIILLVFFIMIGVFFVSPVFEQNGNKQSTPMPSSYNPPKEIKYDSSADLKKELESVNPQVLDSDFENL